MEEKLRKTLVRQGKMKIIYWMQHLTFRIRWLIDRVGGGGGGVGAEDRRKKKKGKEAVGGGHGGVTHATSMQPFCFGRSSSFLCVSIQNYFCLFRCWCGCVHLCLRLLSDQIQHYVYVRSQASLKFYRVSNPIAAAPKRTENKRSCKTTRPAFSIAPSKLMHPRDTHQRRGQVCVIGRAVTSGSMLASTPLLQTCGRRLLSPYSFT